LALNAFKDGVTPITGEIMNELISPQSFALLCEGTEIDSKTGSGVTENAVADYYFAVRFTATGVSTMVRVELEIAADGTGEDLTLEVRSSNFNPDGSNEGTLLATIVVPKEFLPSTAAYWYLPLNLSGLTPGNYYWLKVLKSGDLTNHFHLVGEASQDAAHPAYRRSGTSGAWTANNAIHFKAYSGNAGDVIHYIEGTNKVETYTYSGDDLEKIYRYLPPSDGAAGGVREILTMTWDGDDLIGGGVA